MIDLYEVLAEGGQVRRRPAMFIGVKSLTRLHMWIYGLECSEHFGGTKIQQNPRLGEFNNFVKDKYAEIAGFRESTAGWCNMLLEVERRHRWPDTDVGRIESYAVDRFFKDLDEFVEKHRSQE